MSNLFKSPPPPSEDPSVTAARNREQARAEADKIEQTQDQLKIETRLRNRSGGVRGLLGAGSGLTSLLGKG
jgi:hypothetical protein